MTAVYGLVRFSYVPREDGGFQKTRGRPFADRARIVLDPARLERRFQLFEAICLPSLAAQPPDRFTGIILTSEALPDAFARRLEALLAPHPNIHAVFAPPDYTRTAFTQAIAPHRSDAPVRLTFRLDDDDAVAADYTDHVARYLEPRYAGHCLSLYRGFGLARVWRRPRLWRCRRYMFGVGMGYITRGDAAETIYDCGNHKRVAEHYPTLIDGAVEAYVTTRHGMNDSLSTFPPADAWVRPSATLSLGEARETLGARFPFLAAPDLDVL